MFDQKKFNVKPLGIFIIFYLSLSPACAETIENLQKNASVSYEKMIQAKQSVETLSKDVAYAEKKLASLKQKLTAAEQELVTIKTKFEQAKTSKEQAVNHWKQATDALANEWGKTEIK